MQCAVFIFSKQRKSTSQSSYVHILQFYVLLSYALHIGASISCQSFSASFEAVDAGCRRVGVGDDTEASGRSGRGAVQHAGTRCYEQPSPTGSDVIALSGHPCRLLNVHVTVVSSSCTRSQLHQLRRSPRRSRCRRW